MKVAPKTEKDRSYPICTICNEFNQKRCLLQISKAICSEKQIEKHWIKLVNKKKTLPREGTRKLLESLRDDFSKLTVKMGRTACSTS